MCHTLSLSLSFSCDTAFPRNPGCNLDMGRAGCRLIKEALQALQPFEADSAIFDIGCGQGLLLSYFAILGVQLNGIEVSFPSLSLFQHVSLSQSFFVSDLD